MNACISKCDLFVQALEDCEVLSLSGKDKSATCAALPEMYQSFGQKAFSRYVALQKSNMNCCFNIILDCFNEYLKQWSRITPVYPGKP